MGDIRASIAMASFNGEEYIKEQIDSILNMMGQNDELVISDDHSTDRTVEIIKEIQKRDYRVLLFENPGRGLGKNFENALIHCNGKFIFYSDQDDVWIDNKINECIEVLEKTNASLVVHDGYYTDAELRRCKDNPFGETVFKGYKMEKSPFKVWIGKGGNTLGCCMAFPSSYIREIVPIPNDDHDVWTINLLSRLGTVTYIYKKLILHRMHGGNVSVPHRRNLLIVIISRVVLLLRIYKRRFSIRK